MLKVGLDQNSDKSQHTRILIKTNHSKNNAKVENHWLEKRYEFVKQKA